MKYRELRKKYSKKFGNTMFVALKDKRNKTMRKVSKIVTAHWMKKCLLQDCDGLELLARMLAKTNSDTE
jgi:hypothetical protein